jgi:hypothetical protein
VKYVIKEEEKEYIAIMVFKTSALGRLGDKAPWQRPENLPSLGA